ncbi:MAG: ketopantoate reductase family protein [Deltaproteobacteria bacterium]|nr:ketopantoate reductase family protein [Deltaproteobacteria bacterium]
MTKSFHRIFIIGAGAMGAAYGSILYDMDPTCVSFIVRGERAKRLKERGLIVNGRPYPIHVVTPDRNVEPPDLIMVAVKSHQLPQALEDMKSLVGNSTVFLSVMNGIESEEQLGAVFGMDKVLYAVAVGIDAMRDEHKVTFSNRGKLYFGEADNSVLTERVKTLQSLFSKAGIISETPRSMIRVLWWKFMINVGINQASAVLHAPYGVFQSFPEASSLMESAMGEVMMLAKASKIDLTEKDINEWHGFLSSLAPTGKTSMLQDVEAGRKTEVEIFAGKVISLGKAYNKPTPVNETLYRILRVTEQRYLQSK